jgi:hypothetical protein
VTEAFFLPGLREGAGTPARPIDAGSPLLHPQLDEAELHTIAAALRAAHARHLVGAATNDVVAIIDAAAARLADPGDPLRRVADELLPGVTGLSQAMVQHVLDRMIRDWRAPALHRLLDAELDGGRMLDGFVESDGRVLRASGPALITHVFAGNVPGVSVTSLVRALLVRSASLGKTAAREPLLAVLFARAVASIDAGVGACLAVTYWPGTEYSLLEASLRDADVAVVYGGADAVAAVRRAAPARARVVEHGPKLSLAVVTRDALPDRDAAHRIARDAALATATFDQHGCVSPHMIFVERGGALAPRELARAIAEQLSALQPKLPRGPLDAAAAVRIHEARGRAEFRAIAGADVEVFEAGDAMVIYDGDAGFEPSCLDRTLYVLPVDDGLHAARAIAPFSDVLQSVALECADPRRSDIARALAGAGATRVTSLHALPWPPPEWLHDGRGPLRELVRITELER